MDSLKQYLGVFSANNVDYATQFLLESIPLKADDQLILDLASGNGIIAHSINQSYKEKAWSQPQIHLMDDDFLAVESSKLNLQGDQFVFKFNDNLSIFKEEYFDLIVSNPPFHFEHEVNIELPLSLFEQAQKALKKGGRFILVFNRHLTYRSQLQKLFNACNIIAENPRFVVLECVK
jgi:16S rRNA G1207 methylase RsmC